MKAKRIALVISSLKPGGMERVMVELANYLSLDTTLEVNLISITKGELFYPVSNLVRFHSPKFEIKGYLRFWVICKTVFYLRKTLKIIDPLSILSFGGKYNSFVLLGSFGLGKKCYISDRSRPGISYGKFLDILNPIMYKNSAGIIAQTAEAKRYAELKINHKNIRVIPNPVRIPKTFISGREKIILNVGRFVKTKGQIDLIRICSNLFPDFPDWKLVFVGDGPELSKAVEEVEKLEIKNNIIFVGKSKDVEEFYNRSSVFAFTSVSEGFPNALLESMAFGMACISYDCSAGPSDLIKTDENGYLVKLGDQKQFELKLRTLMSDEELRHSFQENSYKFAQKYSIDTIGLEFKKFILQ